MAVKKIKNSLKQVEYPPVNLFIRPYINLIHRTDGTGSIPGLNAWKLAQIYLKKNDSKPNYVIVLCIVRY